MNDKITYLVRWYFSKTGLDSVMSFPFSKLKEILKEEIDYLDLNNWNKYIILGKIHE
jgi:hypothetical protein